MSKYTYARVFCAFLSLSGYQLLLLLTSKKALRTFVCAFNNVEKNSCGNANKGNNQKRVND